VERHGIDVPIEEIEHVDEHATTVGASAEATWDAIPAALSEVFGRTSGPIARALGCEHVRAEGDPSRIGSTLPGFVVARSIRPALVALQGEHRFSRYALIFHVDDRGDGTSRLRAETRADFPGTRGRLYRAAVIGTRGHVLAVRRMLGAIRRRAERSA